MRGLKICLWVAGVGCLLSVFGLFLPMRMLDAVAQVFGGEGYGDFVVFEYAVRVMSGTYVGIGVFYLILALRPKDYGVLVPFSGLAGVFIGAVCGITGVMVGMPVLWFLGDSLSCAVLGVLIIVFWRRVKVE